MFRRARASLHLRWVDVTLVLSLQCRINLAQDLGGYGVRGSNAWQDALTIYELAERDCEASLQVGGAAVAAGAAAGRSAQPI